MLIYLFRRLLAAILTALVFAVPAVAGVRVAGADTNG